MRVYVYVCVYLNIVLYIILLFIFFDVKTKPLFTDHFYRYHFSRKRAIRINFNLLFSDFGHTS